MLSNWALQIQGRAIDYHSPSDDFFSLCIGSKEGSDWPLVRNLTLKNFELKLWQETNRTDRKTTSQKILCKKII